MEIISILDGLILLYLKKVSEVTAPDLVDYLERRGYENTPKHLALQLRALEAKGLLKLAGSRRRNPSRPGPSANLWKLTPKGIREASNLSSLLGELVEPAEPS